MDQISDEKLVDGFVESRELRHFCLWIKRISEQTFVMIPVILLTICAPLLSQAAPSNQVFKVALIPILSGDISQNVHLGDLFSTPEAVDSAKALTSLIEDTIMKLPNVVVVERQETDRILGEMQIATRADRRIVLGKWLNADLLILGRVILSDEEKGDQMLALRVIDVGRARTITFANIPLKPRNLDERERRDRKRLQEAEAEARRQGSTIAFIIKDPGELQIYKTQFDMSRIDKESLDEEIKHLVQSAIAVLNGDKDVPTVAPLYFMNKTVYSNRLNHIEQEIMNELLKEETGQRRFMPLSFREADAVADEQFLILSGIVDPNIGKCSGIADAYVWGLFREKNAQNVSSNKTLVEFDICMSDGLSQPKTLKLEAPIEDITNVYSKIAAEVATHAHAQRRQHSQSPDCLRPIASNLFEQAKNKLNDIEKIHASDFWMSDFFSDESSTASWRTALRLLESAHLLDPTDARISLELIIQKYSTRYRPLIGQDGYVGLLPEQREAWIGFVERYGLDVPLPECWAKMKYNEWINHTSPCYPSIVPNGIVAMYFDCLYSVRKLPTPDIYLDTNEFVTEARALKHQISWSEEFMKHVRYLCSDKKVQRNPEVLMACAFSIKNLTVPELRNELTKLIAPSFPVLAEWVQTNSCSYVSKMNTWSQLAEIMTKACVEAGMATNSIPRPEFSTSSAKKPQKGIIIKE